jgi:hypothetical protein
MTPNALQYIQHRPQVTVIDGSCSALSWALDSVVIRDSKGDSDIGHGHRNSVFGEKGGEVRDCSRSYSMSPLRLFKSSKVRASESHVQAASANLDLGPSTLASPTQDNGHQDATSTANARATAVNVLKTSLATLRSVSSNIPVPGLAPALDGLLVTINNIQVHFQMLNAFFTTNPYHQSREWGRMRRVSAS